MPDAADGTTCRTDSFLGVFSQDVCYLEPTTWIEVVPQIEAIAPFQVRCRRWLEVCVFPLPWPETVPSDIGPEPNEPNAWKCQPDECPLGAQQHPASPAGFRLIPKV
jgi:hypothetical protein